MARQSWIVLLLVLLLGLVVGSGGKGSGGGKKKKSGGAKRKESAAGADAVRGSATRPGSAQCLLTKGTLEELLKAGSNEFARSPLIAEDCYRRALLVDKTSVLALYNLGLSQMNQRRHDEAIGNFEKALSFDPRYGEAYFGLGSTLYDKAGPSGAAGQVSSHKKLLNRAKTALKRAVEFSPKSYAAYNSLGNVYLGLQDLAGAQSAYEKVVKLSPRAPEGHANLARILSGTGQASGAIQALQTAIGIAPDNVVFYHELATVCKNVGQEQLAKRLLRAALRMAPRHAASHYQLGEMMAGTVFSEEKDIPGAMRHLTRAVTLDPTMAEAFMSLGMLYWGQGQLHRAQDLLKTGLMARPFSEGHANLGIVLSDMGDYDGAIEHFQASMQLNPRLAEAPKCLGDTYKHLNRWKEAIAMYEKALVIRPNYWEALNDLVHALQVEFLKVQLHSTLAV
jgi:tetratricopeptide (TPR) repeat protein